MTIAITTRDGVPEIRVVDHGDGVMPDILPRIFDPLEQGEDLNTRVHQGAGLGLTLARMSARAMDGDVVLSRPARTARPSCGPFRVPRRSFEAAHVPFSKIPIARKFASICDPP